MVRWRRKRLRYIAKQRKRAERRCRRSWRTLTRDRKGTLRPSCAKRFRGPRRRRGQLWITSAPTADVYINRTYCGRTPIRLAIRAGTYDIKLRPKGNLYKPSATKVYVNRRQNSFVVKRTSDWNKRPTPRVATNDPPTRPPPRTQREPVTRFQPSMRKKTRTRTRRISRRQRRVSRRNKIKTLKNTPIEDPFWIAIGPRIFGRFFYYNDDIFQELFPYRLPIGPAISLQFHWYPGAHFTNNALAHIGLIGDFYYALGIQSRTPEPNSIALSTTAYQFHIGLRGRIPIGPIALQIDAGYAQQYFSINTQDPNTLSPVEFPATTYQTLRFGLRLYWSLSERFALFLHSAYRHPLSTGEIGSDEYFPRLFAGQFEAGLGFDVHLLTWMSLRMLGQYQHYFFSFNSEPGDRRVAGGALDQYYHVDLLVAFHF
ncbi:MAG: PEGA domain-containing protein [Myxococcota bacterium]